jgi:hypothetical protein
MIARLGLKKTITLRTTKQWMCIMEYCWQKEPKGQYVNGHEWEDVVNYWQSTFLPAWMKLQEKMRKYDNEGNQEGADPNKPTIIWSHDELIFYAHDWSAYQWVHKTETPKPYAKGEGILLMVADFVSPDYRWLEVSNGMNACVLL